MLKICKATKLTGNERNIIEASEVLTAKQLLYEMYKNLPVDKMRIIK